MAYASFRQMLNMLGWSKKYNPHAARTTGSTRLNELGLIHWTILAGIAESVSKLCYCFDGMVLLAKMFNVIECNIINLSINLLI